MGKIVAISISSKKGIKKENIMEAVLIENYGIKNDAHAGNWHRQISLLDISSINLIENKFSKIKPGDFAENITTEGIELFKLKIGTCSVNRICNKKGIHIIKVKVSLKLNFTNKFYKNLLSGFYLHKNKIFLT